MIANQCDIHLKFIYQYFLSSLYITEISYYLTMYLHIALYRYISEFLYFCFSLFCMRLVFL